MKRFIFLILMCTALADYNEPPGWDDFNDFTHQSWDFYGTVDMQFDGPDLPLIADGQPSYINTFGEPVLIEADNSHPIMKKWYVQPAHLETDRRCMYGGNGDTWLVFKVPNISKNKYWQKHLWIQMTYFARMDGPKNYDILVARDENFTDVNDIELVWESVEDLNEPQGDYGKWFRLTAVYRFDDQPLEEFIKLIAYEDPVPEFAASMIDQVDIDTRCINIDIVEDNKINFKDYAVLANNFNEPNMTCDLSPDGIINEYDLSILFDVWLQSR
jgi:hypothetical protein